MRFLSSTFIGFLLILSCSEKETHSVLPEIYGDWINRDNLIHVEPLAVSKIKSWDALVKSTDEIACENRIPVIEIPGRIGIPKLVFLRNSCRRNMACGLYRPRNIIFIKNNHITKNSLDLPWIMLEALVKKDLENCGNDINFSDYPDKLVFIVSMDDPEIPELPKLLDRLTTSFEMISGRRDLQIMLDHILSPPPPPPLEDFDDYSFTADSDTLK